MAFWLVQLLTGLAGASSLFLVASGLTVIFGVTRVVNFAHGSLAMLGAFIGWTILTHLPRAPAWFLLGVVGTFAAVGVLGALLEIALLRRLYRAPELFQLLATFAIVLMVQDVVLHLWGPDELTISRPRWMRGFVPILGERFPSYDLALIAIGPIVLGALWLLLARTRWGRLVRAATQDREMLGALGVDQRLIFSGVFALGAALAGLAGVLSLPDGSANLGIDLTTITDAFVVVVVGGLGSIVGAYLAAVLIGVLQALGIVLIPKATLVLVFVVMAVVLVLRPNGLLGRPAPASLAAGQIALVRPPGRGAMIAWAALLVAGLLAPFVLDAYWLSVLVDAAIAVIFAGSLHVMMGPGGMVSFGHAAWFGIGAYAAALAVQMLGAPMPVALLLAPVLAGAVACAFGALVVRLAGVYLAMLTLAFAQIVWAIASQWVSVSGGDNGILGIWPPRILGGAPGFALVVVGVAAATTLLLQRAMHAPFGFALRATRDSAQRAGAIGLDTHRLRLAAFTTAGAAAGLAGGLFAYAKGSVFPTYVSIPRSVDALVMVLLGGVQTMAGPVVGALAYTGLADLLLPLTNAWRFVLGAVILLLVLLFPQGIAGAVRTDERR